WQVIHNLIVNADESMPRGGSVTIAAENVTLIRNNPLGLDAGDYIRISVSDRGTGIPEDSFQKIFDPYFTTKRNRSGLGLATCYSIIKRHEGRITVESSLGSGSTFHLYLPACKDAACLKQVRETAIIRGSGRILVMDDEEMIRDVAGRILAKVGYEVESAADGMEAITRYEQARSEGRPFDAVIMDLTIPGGMGGKETIEKLRAIDPGVKAIVSSGYSNDPIMAEFRDHGFCGVVAKPYTIKMLSEAVHTILSRK
ncbi:MAG TPA: ATP-binding protein, partial [Nitrospirota bacterium]